jgi:hypothetical protein
LEQRCSGVRGLRPRGPKAACGRPQAACEVHRTLRVHRTRWVFGPAGSGAGACPFRLLLTSRDGDSYNTAIGLQLLGFPSSYASLALPLAVTFVPGPRLKAGPFTLQYLSVRAPIPTADVHYVAGFAFSSATVLPAALPSQDWFVAPSNVFLYHYSNLGIELAELDYVQFPPDETPPSIYDGPAKITNGPNSTFVLTLIDLNETFANVTVTRLFRRGSGSS